jgi:predicted nuclease of predicted toxin-antitoxin system
MLPSSTANHLGDLGHDAVSVASPGLREAADENIYALAVDQQRLVVTENFADFARLVEHRHALEESCVPVVFVRKRDFPRGGMAVKIAQHLHEWARANPDPYPGAHWP